MHEKLNVFSSSLHLSLFGYPEKVIIQTRACSVHLLSTIKGLAAFSEVLFFLAFIGISFVLKVDNHFEI
jgi:hypothetical protein